MTTTTAKQQFDEHAEAVRNLLDDLAGDLGKHARGFDKTKCTHWGYPGDLAHVRDLLQQAHNFLNNTKD